MFRHFDVGSPRSAMCRLRLALLVALAACHRGPRPTSPRPVPAPSVQVGSCATPGRDGVIGPTPRLERADRDLNGDGVSEAIVVDRALCSAEGNCHWNVFVVPPGEASDCALYAGTFEAARLEPLTTKGDDHMADVRGYWNLHGGRLLLQSYRFFRGGYRIVEALICRRTGDKLDCADSDR
jgi:hypothetical protein